jgi:hypothetical protein
MREYEIPIEEVKGHCDRYAATECPGWDTAKWWAHFYEALRREIGEPF